MWRKILTSGLSLILVLIIIGCGNTVLAQTFNKEKLERFAKEQLIKKKHLQADSLKIIPIIYEPANLGAAQSVNNDQLWSGGIAGLSLSGAGQIIGYWDQNQPLLTHQEYSGRTTFKDSEIGFYNAHATQMVGTMIATGIEANAQGMANMAKVNTYNWNDDIAEMAMEAASGLTLSSHPYIEIAGWTSNTSICDANNEYPDFDWMWFSLESENTTKAYQFGHYDAQAQKWDSVSYLAPNYLVVKAAGNQRSEGPSIQPIKHWKYDSNFNCLQDSTTVHELDGGSTGFESINAASVGKNILVVGAVESNSGNFDDLSSIAPISSSGFGPTDDGRIKPDIVAPTNLYTSSSSSNTAYETGNGTSAATAVIAGSIALLREHYQNLNPDTLSSASIRALLAQTADDVGNIGPDYKTGWGLLNTERAARFISSNNSDASKTILKDTVLTNGSPIHFDFEHTSNRPLIITIAWTDPPGTPPSNVNDPSDTLLVNDLDLTVSDPNTVTYYPWKLDPSNPPNAATNGDNEVDNIEQVLISDTKTGTYSITISHKRTLQSGSQRISILVSESEPEIIFETTSNGNWNTGATWSGGIKPSTSLHRANIKHAITLDTTALLRGITFDGASSELILNDQTLNLYGGVYHTSDGIGFSGNSSSTLRILNWNSNSDPLTFKPGFQKLDSLVIDSKRDSIKLGSDLTIFSKLSLQNGVLDASSSALKLVADSGKTAWLEKSSGTLLGNITYSRLYKEESSGWRLISSPVQNEMFSTLSDSFHTQGGVWADHQVTENQSNLWLFDVGSQEFSGNAGADSSFTSGKGYLMYMFDDASGKNPLPAFLDFSGTEPDSAILDLYRGTHDSLSYNLAGNPFAGTLDWHKIVADGTNLGASYAIWDPSGNSGGGSIGFKYYNSTTQLGDAGRYIAPMQGFFVQSINENAELVFRQDQKVSASPIKYGKLIPEQISSINFKLFDENYELLDSQAHLSFSENAHSGTDATDLLRMKFLDGITNQISFLGSENELRVFEGRSSTTSSEEIKIITQTEKEGNYTLNWEKWNYIPSNWGLELVDLLTGYRLDMRKEKEYSFFSNGAASNTISRFKILVQRVLITDSDTLFRYELTQNYPNPFNPNTSILYSLPKAGNVRIEVFNTLGQQVVLLIDEQKSAGKHSIQFNASQFSSGVYFYRIEAGNFSQIRSMVLIK